MAILAPGPDWQMTIGNLSLGPGTCYGLTSVAGWLDLPNVRTLDVAKDVGDGAWNGPDYMDSRVVDIAFDITAENGTSFADAVEALTDNTRPSATPQPITLTLPGRQPETILAKVRRRQIPTAIEYEFGLTSASLQVSSPDWRRFGAALSASTGLPSSTGGLTVPFTVPFTINSSVASGLCALTNPGNETGPVVARIDGPISGPVVTHVASGVSLVFASSFSLGVGEYVLVDMEAKTVLAQGQSSRAQWVTSRGWSGFDPGVNTWAFAGTPGTGGTPALTITATPAWT